MTSFTMTPKESNMTNLAMRHSNKEAQLEGLAIHSAVPVSVEQASGMSI